MSHVNPSTALAAVVVDQLVVGGVETIVISPGSRSAALAIAAALHGDLRTVVAIDERSAGFHALGIARASDAPAAVLSTSGTAPANYFPAVVEADMSCVPLVVISADRPGEMRGVGANQTIDQVGLFGDKVRSFAAIDAPDGMIDENRSWREIVTDILFSATGERPGPVHLNVAFREPTVPVSDDGRNAAEPYRFATPRLDIDHSDTAGDQPEIGSLPAERGVVIAGDGAYDRRDLIDAARGLGWPVLATALSGLRGSEVVTTYEHLLASEIPDELRPGTVVAVGAIGPGTALDRLVAAARNRVRVDWWGRSIDPDRNATVVVPANPVAVLGEVDGEADPGWLDIWKSSDIGCRRDLSSVIEATDRPSGAGVARALDLVEWRALVVASSLPIRDVDAHTTRAGPIYANRGASGIDGFMSTALGVASVWPGTLALTGDLSLLHDSNGFLIDAEIDLTIVVVDNHGGGLFDALPQASHAPDYERLFVTDPRRDLAGLASFHGIDFAIAASLDEMVDLANHGLSSGGLHLVSVPVDRVYDLEVRRRLRDVPRH